MSNQKKILVIVEGEKTEQQFFKSLEAAFSLTFTICCFRANIYALYNKLEELDFCADIKQILIEMHPEYKDALSDKFVYTYLVFDFDAHHPKKDDVRELEDIVSSNIEKIKKMSSFFTDETDPTIGRLYINYPMMESFRTCDDVFDLNYQNEFVSLPDINSFKNYAGTKQLAAKRIDSYNRFDFKQLAKMNVYKLNLLMLCNWESMTYTQYLDNSDATKILDKQAETIAQYKKIAVLNTSLFLLIDYFGDKNGFYRFIMR